MSSRKRDDFSVDMTTGRILPGLLAMAIPLAATSLLQMLFTSADLVVIGNFASEHSLAAVGSTNVLINFSITFFVGLSIGSNVLVSRLLGAGDSERARKAIHTSIGLSVLCGALLTVVGFLMARQALVWMQSPPETLELATLYVQIYCLGMIPSLVCNFGASVLRSKGDTRRPMFYLSFAAMINFLLNLVFVNVFKMDVDGVALATAISQYVGAFLILKRLMNEPGVFRLNLREIWPDLRESLTILRIGVPAGFQGIVFSLSNLVIQSSINGFGPIMMAGSAAAQNLEGFVWLTMNAFTQCSLTYMSQNLGAKKYSRLNKVAFISCACSGLSGFVLGGAMYRWGPFLLGIFDQRPEVIEAGMIRVSYVCGIYWICGLMDCLCGTIRGLGHNVTPTVVSLLGACGTRILWISTIFQIPRFHTEDVLFWSYPGSWTITLVAHFCCYVWMRRAYPRADAPLVERDRVAPKFAFSHESN